MPHNNIWEDDKLSREEESKYLTTYLTNVYTNHTNQSFVLNINSEWGFGKTYFLKNFKKELENINHKVIYFDAWSNDYTKEPLLAFISSIDEAFSPYYDASEIKTKSIASSVFKSTLPLLISILAKHATGMAVDELEEYLSEDETEAETADASQQPESTDSNEHKKSLKGLMSKTAELALKEHKNIGKSISSFKSNMSKLLAKLDELEGIELPVFILIDELDRCRPNYAIELLENIKHLFDIYGLVFVIATDSVQLSHSINSIYGSNFDSERYLKRFFNKEYSLAEPNRLNYISFLFDTNDLTQNTTLHSLISPVDYGHINVNVKIIEVYAEFFKLSLRDLNQTITILNSVIFTWNDSSKIQLSYMIFLIMLKQKSNKLFEEFNNINDENLVKDFFTKFNTRVNNNITIEINSQRCYIHQIIRMYVRMEYLTYREYEGGGSTSTSSPDKEILRKISQDILPYNAEKYTDIVYPIFQDYKNYVIRGNRFK